METSLTNIAETRLRMEAIMRKMVIMGIMVMAGAQRRIRRDDRLTMKMATAVRSRRG
jgi:hypothetical protein